MKNVEIGRPLAAAVILGAVLVTAGLSLFAAWADFASAREELQAQTDTVSRSPRATASGPAAGIGAGAGQLFVEAESETLAAARIDALLRQTVSECGGTVQSSQATAKHDEAGIAGRIEVVAAIEGSNDALQDIILHLESGAPMMLVEGLTIQPVAMGEGGNGQAPLLHADVILSSYWEKTKS